MSTFKFLLGAINMISLQVCIHLSILKIKIKVYHKILLLQVFFRIGASVDASIHYKIGVEANSTLCLHSGSLQSKVCGRIYDEWPGGNITLSVFYQYRRFCGLVSILCFVGFLKEYIPKGQSEQETLFLIYILFLIDLYHKWSEQKSWDPASYTRSLPSSGGQNNRYNQCFGSVDC